jgi:hypothetical protein
MSKLRLHLGFTIPQSMVWAHFEGLTSAKDMWILSGFSLTFWWVLSGSGMMVKKKKRGSGFPLFAIARPCFGGEIIRVASQAVEFQPHTRVKTQPKIALRTRTHWLIHFPKFQTHLTC